MITHETVAALLAAEYVTPREAAGMLDRHINTVYRWCRVGTVDCVHIQGRQYVTTRSLLGIMGLDPETGEIRNPGQLRLMAGGRRDA